VKASYSWRGFWSVLLLLCDLLKHWQAFSRLFAVRSTFSLFLLEEIIFLVASQKIFSGYVIQTQMGKNLTSRTDDSRVPCIQQCLTMQSSLERDLKKFMHLFSIWVSATGPRVASEAQRKACFLVVVALQLKDPKSKTRCYFQGCHWLRREVEKVSVKSLKNTLSINNFLYKKAYWKQQSKHKKFI